MQQRIKTPKHQIGGFSREHIGFTYIYCILHRDNNADMDWKYLHSIAHTDIHIDIVHYIEKQC